MLRLRWSKIFALVLASLLGAMWPLQVAEAASRSKPASSVQTARRVTVKASSTSKKSRAQLSNRTAQRPNSTRVRSQSIWATPTFADPGASDVVRGEDLVVRAAALDALDRYNGSLIAVDAYTGRILTLVNQRLAFQDGFIPCSTIKIVVGLAGLCEGIIEHNTRVRVGRGSLTLAEALAISNNTFFEWLGRKLGFERVRFYARLLGLGEPAGLGIPEEKPGVLPSQPPPSGVGRMCSFGEGIRMTPLQLAAILAALANGGTLYYLQYPRSQEEIWHFVPRVKRQLPIGPWLTQLEEGLRGATLYGTAQRVRYLHPEPILGKTGTCTDYEKRAHMGWFGCFNATGRNRLAVVVMLTGGGAVNGPVASQIAARFFRNLYEIGYLDEALGYSPVALKSVHGCCGK